MRMGWYAQRLTQGYMRMGSCQVWSRSGHKYGKGFGKRAAHPSQFFREYHPRAGACRPVCQWLTLVFCISTLAQFLGSLFHVPALYFRVVPRRKKRLFSRGELREWNTTSRTGTGYHVKAFVFLSNLLKDSSQPPPFSMPSKLLTLHGAVKVCLITFHSYTVISFVLICSQ